MSWSDLMWWSVLTLDFEITRPQTPNGTQQYGKSSQWTKVDRQASCEMFEECVFGSLINSVVLWCNDIKDVSNTETSLWRVSNPEAYVYHPLPCHASTRFTPEPGNVRVKVASRCPDLLCRDKPSAARHFLQSRCESPGLTGEGVIGKLEEDLECRRRRSEFKNCSWWKCGRKYGRKHQVANAASLVMINYAEARKAWGDKQD